MLTVSFHKSFIGKRSINIFGATVSKDHRKVQPQRIYALAKIPPPLSISELRTFLGGYRYIAEHVEQLNLSLQRFDALTKSVPATKVRRLLFYGRRHCFRIIYMPIALLNILRSFFISLQPFHFIAG